MFSYVGLLFLFFLALLLEDVGFILLSRGMKATRAEEGRGRIRAILRHPEVLLGVFLQAVYFILLLGLLRELPVSLVVPMTGFGYVLTALLARLFIGERVPLLRWGGICLITAGVVLIARSGTR
ncbi:MAG: EamA family transporter [Nitrospirae bacterium]|nr:EamA family transporter [Nitrospirota bacterium]MCL5285030.1 EamA family transporter [Nitrospirota bacterium]